MDLFTSPRRGKNKSPSSIPKPRKPGRLTPKLSLAPNGIALSPDQTTLYASDYGGLYVWLFTIKDDGSLFHKSLVITMKAPEKTPTVAFGDGMTTDSEGHAIAEGDGGSFFRGFHC